MKKNYEMPNAELVKVVSEEIMLLSCNDNSGSGEVIDWENWDNA